MSDALFIAGYYRSGTSALSGALQRLGVKLFNEADPNEHNPLGFYEIPELIEFDVDLFNRLGVEWTDIRGLAPGWAERADIASFVSRLEEILRRRFSAADAVWGLKHPHLCRALPLYERAARQAGHKPHVVHIFREPWIAAASQQHKNGLSRAHALLLWMSYITSAERQARHLPRSWVTYHELLAEPAAQLRRIERDTGIALTRLRPNGLQEASGHLTGQLNRSKNLPHGDLARPLRELVTNAWEAILARDTTAETWDGLAAETAGMVSYLIEIGSSRGRVIPAFGVPMVQAVVPMPISASLRPAERLDEGGKTRLLARAEEAASLPNAMVFIVAPQGRAHAVNDTLESLRGQWHTPGGIKILSADAMELPDCEVVASPADPGAISRLLCAELNAAAEKADYVAIINAGDVVAPDACLRFALAAADSGADLIYCDEIVPRENGAWVRPKPGWDVTRLRQSAYLGDWVWYKGAALARLGGFDESRAGAEEYDFQLRLAEANGAALRLAEALFTRSAQSRRDAIPADVFCARAAEAVSTHLTRSRIPATVQNRQHPGLFHHIRPAPDPGTTTILLCDHAEIAALDQWLTVLLTGDALTGPVILAGASLSESVARYLTAVSQQTEALEGKVLAVPPAPGMTEAGALAKAFALATSEYVAVLDARAQSSTPHWAEALRSRLADPGIALVAARALVPLNGGHRQFSVQGPIVPGADTRLGAGHLADDPGPGGWLMTDQEASAAAPPALLLRRAMLASCEFPNLSGDALWIDLCAQLRAQGRRIVWTPDVSFIAPPESIRVDAGQEFRQGGKAARALPSADPYHHPALSLHGDLLVTEQRLGLVRAAPADPLSLLVSGPADTGAPVLNAARALRRLGGLEADWAPEPLSAADVVRRDPTAWVRVNPERTAPPHSRVYSAVFSTPPGPEAKAVIAEASEVFATSPELLRQVRALAAPGKRLSLWRPALSAPVWQGFQTATGLNTRPRVLWIDEGIAPGWFTDFINETLETVAWIVVERPGSAYSGAVARIHLPAAEHDWATALGQLAPQILVRPADTQTGADQSRALIAAAAGCHLLLDERLDIPASLGAVRLPNRIAAWQRALTGAVRDLTATLQNGRRTREAALALPSLEDAAPPWAPLGSSAMLRSAAE